MRTSFFGLEIARRALLAQQKALDVTGHNIANANTQGYTRQEAIMTTTNPWSAPAMNRNFQGQLGTGVQVDSIRRIRDSFLDMQSRKESNSLGYWEGKQDALQKIEVIMNEPSDQGIRSVLDQYWFAMQELSKNPESLAVRATVLERGVVLAESFNHIDRQLKELQMDVDTSIQIKTEEVNNLALQIAGLNDQITNVEAPGDQANDLRDKRDNLIDQLASLVDVKVAEERDGSNTIIAAGRALVWGNNTNLMFVEQDPSNQGFVDIKWTSDKESVSFKGGNIKGLLQTRDETIVGYQTQINDLAFTVASEVNLLHRSGFSLEPSPWDTGLDFFIAKDGLPINAGNLAVNQDLRDNPSRLAAASNPNEAGDGSNALKIAQLKNQSIMLMPGATSGMGTFDDFFRASVAQLGVDAQEANRMTENQSFLVAQISNQKDSVSGVSLDEEMTNMIKFQHAYNAAARLITTVDEMIDTIVNKMGLVGR